MFGRILNMPMYLWVLLNLHSCFRFCFRRVQTYSSIIQEHTHAYSKPCVSWHISITKHIQTLRYIHSTILNIFTKAQSCTFDTLLNVPVFYRCFYRLLEWLYGNFEVIIRTYSGIFKTCSTVFSLVKEN